MKLTANQYLLLLWIYVGVSTPDCEIENAETLEQLDLIKFHRSHEGGRVSFIMTPRGNALIEHIRDLKMPEQHTAWAVPT